MWPLEWQVDCRCWCARWAWFQQPAPPTPLPIFDYPVVMRCQDGDGRLRLLCASKILFRNVRVTSRTLRPFFCTVYGWHSSILNMLTKLLGHRCQYEAWCDRRCWCFTGVKPQHRLRLLPTVAPPPSTFWLFIVQYKYKVILHFVFNICFLFIRFHRVCWFFIFYFTSNMPCLQAFLFIMLINVRFLFIWLHTSHDSLNSWFDLRQIIN